jgi:hypothetical protein
LHVFVHDTDVYKYNIFLTVKYTELRIYLPTRNNTDVFVDGFILANNQTLKSDILFKKFGKKDSYKYEVSDFFNVNLRIS